MDIKILDYVFQVNDIRDASVIIISLIIIHAFAILLKTLVNKLGIELIYYPFMLIVGFFIGLIFNLCFDSTVIRNNTSNKGHLLFMFSIPILYFHTAFVMEYHGFRAVVFQVMIMAFPLLPLQICLLTGITTAIFTHDYEWSWAESTIFSTLCCIIQSNNVINELNYTQVRVKHIQLFLQGEQIANLVVTSTIMTHAYEVIYTPNTDVLSNMYILLMGLVSFIIGLIYGYMVGYVMIKTINDCLIPIIVFTIFAAYSSFLLGHLVLYQVGVVLVLTTATVISPFKAKMSQETEHNLASFWEVLSFHYKTLAFLVPGIIVGLDPKFITLHDAVMALIIYLVCWCTRALQYFGCRFLLNMIGPQFSWSDISIIVIGPYRAAPALLMACLYRQYQPYRGQQMLTYIAMLCLFASVINTFTLPMMLRISSMYKLSPAREINLRNAIAHVHEQFAKILSSLKYDRANSCTNWKVVQEKSKLSSPLINENVPVTSFRVKSEEQEARQRILNVQMVSLWHQHDTGILSKRGMRFLIGCTQNTMEKPGTRFQFSDLHLIWAPSKFTRSTRLMLKKALRYLPNNYKIHTENRARMNLLIMFNSVYYKFTSVFILLVDAYFNLEYIIDFGLTNTLLVIAYVYILGSFCLLFFLEFILLITALGPRLYFSYTCNKTDFLVNVVIAGAVVLSEMFCLATFGRKYSFWPVKLQKITEHSRILLLLRLNRLHIIIRLLCNMCLHIIDSVLNSKLVYRYEIGKAYLIAVEASMKHIRRITQNQEIFVKLRKELEEDRKQVCRALGIIQRESPNVALTIKTSHAIKQVINEMKDCVREIYDGGFLDVTEQKTMIESIGNTRGGRGAASIKEVTPLSPELMLKSVHWLSEEDDAAAFLLNNAQLQGYSYEDVIVEVGEIPRGIFFLISGIVKCFYKPNETAIQHLKTFGQLPNCDFFINLKLEESQEDYISGNVIGEIGAVTERKFDMRIQCESEIQLYFIPQAYMKKVLELYPVVYKKIWRSIGIKLSILILQYEPEFQGWSHEKILLYLKRSFVPSLKGLDEIYVTDMISDVLLIEGMARDGLSAEVYLAPYRIPRTTYRIQLSTLKSWMPKTTCETRLLIIPSKESCEEEVMQRIRTPSD